MADDAAAGTWTHTFRRLSEQTTEDLVAGDLERLATAAYMTGQDDDAVSAWEAAHRRHLHDGRPSDGARCGFWAAFTLMMQGKMAHAGGWLSRTQEITSDLDCAACGFLMIPALLRALDAGEPSTAHDHAVAARAIAERFDDVDLGAFGRLGQGQALIALGKPDRGLALLDDVMLSVESGEVGPITSGVVYCAVILECMHLFEIARAAEWTAALDRWCATQPDLVPYRGQCLVHQSQLQQAAGDWPTATTTARSARARLTEPPHPALGLACYQDAELLRLVGDFNAAVDAYGRASAAGHQPMPGLALLDSARGNLTAAIAGIERALAETSAPLERAPLLRGAVEIHRAAGDIDAARVAADELDQIAAQFGAAVLVAMAAEADGTVLLASGDVAGALARLRAATTTWQRLAMPYEGARVAVLVGLGCLAMGDSSTATLEFDRARATFTALGAVPDLERVDRLTGEPPPRPTAGSLTDRELEVLRHVAAGETNRAIAESLTISQHTVSRHLENIFTKLGVTSRAAATSYAYEHDLL